MGPTLILDYLYEPSVEIVKEKIFQYDFLEKGENDRVFDVARIGGIRYKEKKTGCLVLAWQCNMANIQNYEIRLPAIITIETDRFQRIENIKLDQCFKGSQGIPCSHSYLNRHMRQELIGQKLSPENAIIKDPLALNCRHLYELVYGSCCFMEWCHGKEVTDGFLSETTGAFRKGEGIVALDRTNLNGKEATVKLQVEGFGGNLHYNIQGAIEKCDGMFLQAGVKTGEEAEIAIKRKEIQAGSKTEFQNKVMKYFSKPWIRAGKALGVEKKYYFSQLWPPTLFGIFSQMLAMTVYSNSYAYFQHSISGLQRDGDRCFCIGVIKNLDEGVKLFDGFTVEDLL